VTPVLPVELLPVAAVDADLDLGRIRMGFGVDLDPPVVVLRFGREHDRPVVGRVGGAAGLVCAFGLDALDPDVGCGLPVPGVGVDQAPVPFGFAVVVVRVGVGAVEPGAVHHRLDAGGLQLVHAGEEVPELVGLGLLPVRVAREGDILQEDRLVEHRLQLLATLQRLLVEVVVGVPRVLRGAAHALQAHIVGGLRGAVEGVPVPAAPVAEREDDLGGGVVVLDEGRLLGEVPVDRLGGAGTVLVELGLEEDHDRVAVHRLPEVVDELLGERLPLPARLVRVVQLRPATVLHALGRDVVAPVVEVDGGRDVVGLGVLEVVVGTAPPGLQGPRAHPVGGVVGLHAGGLLGLDVARSHPDLHGFLAPRQGRPGGEGHPARQQTDRQQGCQ
jgi:hypothetical protein